MLYKNHRQLPLTMQAGLGLMMTPVNQRVLCWDFATEVVGNVVFYNNVAIKKDGSIEPNGCLSRELFMYRTVGDKEMVEQSVLAHRINIAVCCALWLKAQPSGPEWPPCSSRAPCFSILALSLQCRMPLTEI